MTFFYFHISTGGREGGERERERKSMIFRFSFSGRNRSHVVRNQYEATVEFIAVAQNCGHERNVFPYADNVPRTSHFGKATQSHTSKSNDNVRC